jgi:hypothetical protein
MSADRQWLEQSLRSSLEALAMPGDQALSTQPDHVCKAEELALVFDNLHRAFVGNFASEILPSQVAALRKIDTLLDEMSGEHLAVLWTDEAVKGHERWSAVRAAARDALREMKWLDHAA